MSRNIKYKTIQGNRYKIERVKDGDGQLLTWGKPKSFVINYTTRRAVRYSLDGAAIEILPNAVRLGEGHLRIRKRIEWM